MRAYLIDPFAKQVTEVEYTGHYKNINEHIKADIFCVVGLDDGDSVFIDDEGLLCDQEEQEYFWVGDYPQMLAGRGLVLGTDDEGESVSPKCSLDWLQENVRFQNKATAPLFMPDLAGEVYTWSTEEKRWTKV